MDPTRRPFRCPGPYNVDVLFLGNYGETLQYLPCKTTAKVNISSTDLLRRICQPETTLEKGLDGKMSDWDFKTGVHGEG
jgi:hypothetical protein